MRKLTQYATPESKQLLELLGDVTTPTSKYKRAFEEIGRELATTIAPLLSQKDSVLLAGSSEDADWLMKGIFDNLPQFEKRVAVFWNERTNPVIGIPEFDLAPVIKSYIESPAGCDTLIICKSIIFTSCVIRTNLRVLLDMFQPAKVIIASPVMYKGADQTLRDEFKGISDQVSIIYFAEDDDEENGNVKPGVGGQVYLRLGIGDSQTKNKYIPKFVAERRALQHR